MSNAETRLAHLWDTTRAPSHDLAFALALEARIARRLMLLDVTARTAAGLAVLALLAWLGPTLLAHAAPLAGQLDAAGPVLAAVAVLGAVMVRLTWPAWDGFGRDLEEGGETRG
jgi:peptidoglycan/LPS O-acetylase OafA/YrhL